MGKELIDELKKYISENAIRWSARCLERMQERDISRADVKNVFWNEKSLKIIQMISRILIV